MQEPLVIDGQLRLIGKIEQVFICCFFAFDRCTSCALNCRDQIERPGNAALACKGEEIG